MNALARLLRGLWAPRVHAVKIDDWDQPRRVRMTPEECEEYNAWARDHQWRNLEPREERRCRSRNGF